MSRRSETMRAALLLGGCALLAVGLLAGVHALTEERIAAAEHRREMAALATVLPPGTYDNDPVADAVTVLAPDWLGTSAPVEVRRARTGGRPAALVVPVVAAGYAGPIRLLVGVTAQGRILGARVTAHQETPGLGDWIEAGRSRWIEDFGGRSLGQPPLTRWRVRKDGGEFDQFAGATVTPRAVVTAIARLLQYVERHGAALFEAPAGGRVEHRGDPLDAPAPAPSTSTRPVRAR